MTTPWEPLLEGAHAEQACAVIDDIARRLDSPAPQPGLKHAAGRALLFSYLDRAEALDIQLEAASAAADRDGAWLLEGATGVAFALAHLGCDVEAEIDHALGEAIEPTSLHELGRGVAGVGIYALEHMPASTRLLERVIAWLDEHALRAERGRYFFTPGASFGPLLRELHPEGGIDLGVPHGHAGVIAVAGAAASWNISGARSLYEDLVAYLWTQAQPESVRFRAVVGAPQGRLAWCYGDAGTATAVYAAARAAGDHDTCAQAIELARRATTLSPENVGVVEASLCHGTAGLAHLYNRFAQATGDDFFARAARDYYLRALAMPLSEWSDLLEGQLGVALALTAATTAVEPAWDRALAITVNDAATAREGGENHRSRFEIG
ncbi:MAG TPA: lanthionine synthetase LanC family protein [Kofleriaceae bacterium]|nr:lanthionine synthetase LanC family protein [Kofleriaceae bacterium]